MKADSTRAPIGATPLTTTPDADILAAWGRITAAHAALAACPVHAGPGEYSPAERAQWDIVDAAEAIIRTTKATTAAGVEIQLWVGLIHAMNDDGVEQAILRRDLDWFDERDGEFDWFERLFIAAIRSLRSMGDVA
ncbi:MAG: hypothetical protein KAF42_02025 [Sphingopyxis terrae]|nr:hypothetical protein [Sphingopyxis terrae]